MKPESFLDDASPPLALLLQQLGTFDVGGVVGLSKVSLLHAFGHGVARLAHIAPGTAVTVDAVDRTEIQGFGRTFSHQPRA